MWLVFVVLVWVVVAAVVVLWVDEVLVRPEFVEVLVWLVVVADGTVVVVLVGLQAILL